MKKLYGYMKREREKKKCTLFILNMAGCKICSSGEKEDDTVSTKAVLLVCYV